MQIFPLPEPELKEPDELKEIINSMFEPAPTIAQADEILAGYELLEAVSPFCDTSREFLFKTMKALGFKTKVIVNDMYWLVNYKPA